jgi:hypothetical protein
MAIWCRQSRVVSADVRCSSNSVNKADISECLFCANSRHQRKRIGPQSGAAEAGTDTIAKIIARCIAIRIYDLVFCARVGAASPSIGPPDRVQGLFQCAKIRPAAQGCKSCGRRVTSLDFGIGLRTSHAYNFGR